MAGKHENCDHPKTKAARHACRMQDEGYRRTCTARNVARLRKRLEDPDYRDHVNAQSRVRLANSPQRGPGWRKIGMTNERYAEFYTAQDGKCAICKRPLRNRLNPDDTDGLKSRPDHCHTTGRHRGLLCDGCNGTLGWYEKQEHGLIETYLDRTVDFAALAPARVEWVPELTRSNRYYWRKFGGTPDNYAQLWELQRGLCGICLVDLDSLPRGKDGRCLVQFDHCPDSMTPRGLLCSACNPFLGKYERRFRSRIDIVDAYIAGEAA